MEDPKFTKGEWFVADDYLVGSSTRTISECGFSGIADDHEEKANTYLIAAAPEMYAMLEVAMEEIATLVENHNLSVGDPCAFIDAETAHNIRLLLAKARGEKND